MGGTVAAEVVGEVLGEERDDAVRIQLADPVEVEEVASDALEGGGGGVEGRELDEAVGGVCVLDAEGAEGVDLLVGDEVADDLVGEAVELLEIVCGDCGLEDGGVVWFRGLFQGDGFPDAVEGELGLVVGDGDERGVPALGAVGLLETGDHLRQQVVLPRVLAVFPGGVELEAHGGGADDLHETVGGGCGLGLAEELVAEALVVRHGVEDDDVVFRDVSLDGGHLRCPGSLLRGGLTVHLASDAKRVVRVEDHFHVGTFFVRCQGADSALQLLGEPLGPRRFPRRGEACEKN